MIALGIDLVILGIILYVVGYAAQDLDTRRAYWANMICIPLSIVLFLAAPWLIVYGV